MKPTAATEYKVHAWGLGACLLLTAAVFWVGWRPWLAGRAERLAAAATWQQARQEHQEAEAALRSVKQQLATVKKQWAQMPLHLLPLGQLNQRLADLAALAAQQKLEVAGVRPGGPRAAKHYQVVALPVTGRGSYEHFVHFLRELHRQCPDMGVTSLTLRAAEAGQASFALSLVWYATLDGNAKP